jgi:trigger factor
MVKTTIKKLEKSELEIIGVLEYEELVKNENKALENIGERLELPGFRKGKAPANIVKSSIPEMELLEEMAELALYNEYPKILEENKIDAIGRPQITITKIGKGSPLEFKIITAILPEMKLPDYKKIAKEQKKKDEFNKKVIVPEDEVLKVINDLRKMRAEQKNNSHEGHEGMTEEEHEKIHAEKNEIPESEWPVFDDEFAKSFGDFKTADELREKITNNLKKEKETAERDKLRLAIAEEIISHSEGEMPEVLIESEMDKILYRLKSDIANMGFKFDDYLVQIKKTEDDLRKEWRPDAVKRAKLQIIIHTISEKEKLTPSKVEIDSEVKNIMETYKEADPTRAQAYVEQILENEKVFSFLETQ